MGLERCATILDFGRSEYGFWVRETFFEKEIFWKIREKDKLILPYSDQPNHMQQGGSRSKTKF
jgi:hypothetical protein